MNESFYLNLASQLEGLQSPTDFETLHTYLSQLQGSEYDFVLLSQLFAKINKNTDSLITVEEFLTSLIDAQQIISDRIKTLKGEIEEFSGQMEHNFKLAEQSKRSEKFNSLGISVNSELRVDVEHLALNAPRPNVYVRIECDGQLRRSKIKTTDLTYDESFKFAVMQGSGDVKFTALQTPETHVGEMSIPLEILKAQELSDAAFDLLSASQDIAGSIKLRLLWIWNYTLYYESLATHWEQLLGQATTDTLHLNSQLLKLMLPFNLYEISQSSRKSSDRDVQAVQAQEDSQPSSLKDFASNHDDQKSSSFVESSDQADSASPISLGEFRPEIEERQLSLSDFQMHLEKQRSLKAKTEEVLSPQKADKSPISKRSRITSLHEKSALPQIKTEQEVQVSKPVKAYQVTNEAADVQEVVMSAETPHLQRQESLGYNAVVVLILVASLFSTFTRTDFLNVRTTQLSLVGALLVKAELSLTPSVISAVLIVSQVLDLVWLAFVYGDTGLPDGGLRPFVFWASVAGFVGKCVLLKAEGS
jgi:hypothetical protein